jgi:chromatin remodeling complex protein RSC6
MSEPSSHPKPRQPLRGGVLKPAMPDAALAAIIGQQPLSRSEVVRKVWDYIRQHNLQDPADRTYIKPDDNLRRVLDGETRVGMFEMTKRVFKHLM